MVSSAAVIMIMSMAIYSGIPSMSMAWSSSSSSLSSPNGNFDVLTA